MKKRYIKRVIAGLLTICMVLGLAVVNSSTGKAAYSSMADIEKDFKAAFQNDANNLSATSAIVTDSNITTLTNYTAYQEGGYTSLADYLFSFDSEGNLYRDQDAGTSQAKKGGFLYYNTKLDDFTLEMEFQQNVEQKGYHSVYVGFGAQSVGANGYTDEYATHIRMDRNAMYLQDKDGTTVLHNGSNVNNENYATVVTKYEDSKTAGEPVWFTFKLNVSNGVATWWIDGYKFSKELVNYQEGLLFIGATRENTKFRNINITCMENIEKDFKAAFQNDANNLSAASAIVTDSNITTLTNYTAYQEGGYTSLADYLFSFDSEGNLYRDQDAGTSQAKKGGFLYYNTQLEDFTLEMEYQQNIETKGYQSIYVGFGAQSVGANGYTDEYVTHIRMDRNAMYLQDKDGTTVLHNGSNVNNENYATVVTKYEDSKTAESPVWFTFKLNVSDGVATWWIDGYEFSKELVNYQEGLLFIGATRENTKFRNIKITPQVSSNPYDVYYATDNTVNVGALTSDKMVQTDFENCWSLENGVFTRTGTGVYQAASSGTKGSSLLYFCEQSYEEFDMTLEYAINKNSGYKWMSVGFGADAPGKSFLDDDGYMVNIERSGQISYYYPDGTTTNATTFINATENAVYNASVTSADTITEWHTAHITVGNGKVTVSYDGGNVSTQEITDYAGYIYLCCSTDGMQFRNISIKPLTTVARGDVDKSGTVDVVDLVRMKKVSDGVGGSNNYCDLNEDTAIDKYDISILKRILLGITSTLEGKKALFLGDSIAYGADDIVKGLAWGKRIEATYGTESTVAAISGTRLSTYEGKGVIVTQVKNISDGDTYDYVILHGGVNDVWNSQSLGVELTYGELTAEGTTEFDTATVYGALENLISVSKAKCPNAKLGYVINFDISNKIGDMTEMVAAIKAVCEKWDVPVLDLYNHEEFNAGFDASIHLDSDGVHPIKEGYEYITAYIGEWMETIQ